jgi:leader peptidase (prepilin peptidase)/N-methyltransferase
MARYIDLTVWAKVPFHFWSVIAFVLGCIVGSFLNVCIHRLPRGLSIISPPSHCPHCQYSIPWYLNIPLFTWIFLRGRCANCGAPISPRYFVVELLTGLVFLGSWLYLGHRSVALVFVYWFILSGFIIATFIDFEHFIIPDEITIGGAVAGFVCSFLVPGIHGASTPVVALERSALGIGVGAGVIYLILRLGKLLFGRQRISLPPGSRIIFTETALVLPDQEVPYEELFYRKSDSIALEARHIELIDRCYKAARLQLRPDELRIGDDRFDPETVPHLEATTDRMVLPREAMGLGDVKFMAAIGAFLGWQATLFALMVSSVIGAMVGLTLILLKMKDRTSRLPYGPYIAMAATIWMFGGNRWLNWWLNMGR